MNEETLILNKGYKVELSEGSIVTPVFRSSTFCFPTAESGERSFELAYMKDVPKDNEIPALIYSRVNNPNMEILEEKLSVFDNAEKVLMFSSGMGAISNTCMALLNPGDKILYSSPVYGGTKFLFNSILPKYNINSQSFLCGTNPNIKETLINNKNIKMIYIETPCNPLLKITSIKEIKLIIDEIENEENRKIILVVDNTMCGPTYLKPIALGADLVIYSISKFIGGHSDLIAGSVSGSKPLIDQIRVTRTIFGTIPDPDTCWLIQRSLPTLKLRMNDQCQKCKKIVEYLSESEYVEKLFYPGLGDEYQNRIFNDEYSDSGSMLSFKLNTDKKGCFNFLNNLKVFKLAVSLGSVESLIQHPWSMTHSEMSTKEKEECGITENLIRASIGLENEDDLIDDLKNSFKISF